MIHYEPWYLSAALSDTLTRLERGFLRDPRDPDLVHRYLVEVEHSGEWERALSVLERYAQSNRHFDKARVNKDVWALLWKAASAVGRLPRVSRAWLYAGKDYPSEGVLPRVRFEGYVGRPDSDVVTWVGEGEKKLVDFYEGSFSYFNYSSGGYVSSGQIVLPGYTPRTRDREDFLTGDLNVTADTVISRAGVQVDEVQEDGNHYVGGRPVRVDFAVRVVAPFVWSPSDYAVFARWAGVQFKP